MLQERLKIDDIEMSDFLTRIYPNNLNPALQYSADTFAAADDLENTGLLCLEYHFWQKIKNNATLKISIQIFLTHRRYVKTNAISKDTNEPLDINSWFSYQHENDDEQLDIQDNKSEYVMKKNKDTETKILFLHFKILSFKDDVRINLSSITYNNIVNDEDHPHPHINEQQLDTMKTKQMKLYTLKNISSDIGYVLDTNSNSVQ
ncbi:hypothetical protein PV328_006062 [Microctonus aethiopoides]|uniref:Uncharacterized protein n=1 Tax=Microctonus aethiopoides TaxID=144406 RepID=A0AA39FNH8_9HYME|nr:hypothetical protein PV328_006062 [Microctonus aethiopoides]